MKWTIKLEIPFPPSVNHYWGQRGTIKYLTKKAKAFRERVIEIVKQQEIKQLDMDLSMHMVLYPPDRRRRDADNHIKPVQDALQHAGLFLDDSCIQLTTSEKRPFIGKNEAAGVVFIQKYTPSSFVECCKKEKE